MGRTLLNAVENLELAEPYKEALRTFGYEMEELEPVDEDEDVEIAKTVLHVQDSLKKA